MESAVFYFGIWNLCRHEKLAVLCNGNLVVVLYQEWFLAIAVFFTCTKYYIFGVVWVSYVTINNLFSRMLALAYYMDVRAHF